MKETIEINSLNSNDNLISVIVPIYNVEKYLKKCIDSILNQTYKNLEIILVDDGSPDDCGKICDEYAKLDKRIKVIHKKNGGLSDARNVGIDMASGNYIGFVDSDDYIAIDMYEYLYKILTENDSDISMCNFEYVYEDNSFPRKISKIKNNETLESKDVLRKLSAEILGNFSWNKLYKKELFKKIRYPVGRKVEDCGTTYRLFDLSKKITLGKEVKYYYLQRGNSILHKKDFSLYKDFYELTLERYKYIKNKYPDIIENDIDMINKILALYQENSFQGKEYIKSHEQEIMSLFNDITKNKTFKKSIDLKYKIKLKLFKFNKKLFIKMSNLKNKKNISNNNFLILNLKLKYFIREIARNIKYSLKNKKIFLEKNKKRVFVFLAADYGNIGDIAITYSQEEFLKNIFSDYQLVEINLHDTHKYLPFIRRKVKSDDIITIIGGGNMTNRYDFIEEARRMVIKTFKNNKIISFPQTIEFTDDEKGQESKKRSQKIYSKNKNLIIFAREKKSFDKMKEIFPNNKVLICPDIVMYLKGKLNINENIKRNKIGICLRDDKEKLINTGNVKEKIINIYGKENIVYMSTHTGDENYNHEKRYEYFFDLIDEITKREVFITDRLHGMIFCYLTNTPCLAFDNDNHKVSETYTLWLKECKYIKLINEKETNNVKKYIDELKDIEKEDINLEDKFNILKKFLIEK